MSAERPPASEAELALALEEPDFDDGHRAARWIAGRTVIVYYNEYEDELDVESVSATTRRLAS